MNPIESARDLLARQRASRSARSSIEPGNEIPIDSPLGWCRQCPNPIHSVLATLLGIDNKRKVTDIIQSARLALSQHFAHHHVGLAHISRQDVIQHHTSSIATQLLTENRNPCILVLDGTYFYIQVTLIFYTCCIFIVFFCRVEKL